MQSSGEVTGGVHRPAQVVVRVMLAMLAVGVSCKRDPAANDAAPAASDAAPPSAAGSAAITSPRQTPAASSAVPAAAESLSAPPESFSGGEKVDVVNAVGLGCEARSSQGWLQLLCRKKNGTGGRPVRAIRDFEAFNAEQKANAGPAPLENTEGNEATPPAAAEGAKTEAAEADAGSASGELANVIEPDEQGELRVLLPWRPGHSAKVRVEWTDTSYDLEIDGTVARLVLPVSLALRRQCEVLRKQSQAVVDAADESPREEGLNRTDVAKLPRFGLCQTAGLGAWALELQKLEATGTSSTRTVRATFGVAHVDPQGEVKRGAFGTLAFAPQGLQAKPLMVYDYDADGQQELIVRYEVTKTAEAATKLPAVFTLRGGEVLAYSALEPMGPGAVIVEQLDHDMRPDIADLGPYVAWLSSDCGAKVCPDRISGPQFFAYSQKDGTFSRTHSTARSALERACPRAPEPIVAVQGAGVNIALTAQRVACAKVWKVDEGTLSAALAADRSKLCSGAEDCPLYRALNVWVSTPAPATL